MKKVFVLSVLFALPIVAYLFFASGKNNFARLPVLTDHVEDVSSFKTLSGEPVSFKNKISVVAFFGDNLANIQGNMFNLDQKVLEKYYAFNDFQFLIILPEGTEPQVKAFTKEFKDVTRSKHWKFLFAEPEKIRKVFHSFDSNLDLAKNLYTPYVFIIDKDAALRGRNDDEDLGILYGYDSRSVVELGNKMNDDVKVILAEYRLELKKYKAKRGN